MAFLLKEAARPLYESSGDNAADCRTGRCVDWYRIARHQRDRKSCYPLNSRFANPAHRPFSANLRGYWLRRSHHTRDEHPHLVCTFRSQRDST